jgi:hypothetical protein
MAYLELRLMDTLTRIYLECAGVLEHLESGDCDEPLEAGMELAKTVMNMIDADRGVVV